MLNSSLKGLFNEAEIEKFSDHKNLLGLCRAKGIKIEEIEKKINNNEKKLCYLSLLVEAYEN
jgi:hypothetical protein